MSESIDIPFTFTKYMFVVFCAFFLYDRFVHPAPRGRYYLLATVYSIGFGAVMVPLRLYVPEISILLMALCFAGFLRLTQPTAFSTAFTLSVLAFAITFVANFFATVLVAIIIFPWITYQSLWFECLQDVLVFLIELGLLFLLFRIKRLKNSMPMLLQYGSNDVGLIISISLLLFTTLFGLQLSIDPIVFVCILIIIICAVLLMVWWRRHITASYLKKSDEREMEKLAQELAERDAQIQRLRHHHDEMSAIIHKDNKLIPALQLTVRDLLRTAQSGASSEELREKSDQLLAHLESVSRERAGIVQKYESQGRTLPATGIFAIDSLLSYMNEKARSEQVTFTVSVSGSLKDVVGLKIEESALSTLLADLLDNAIIATRREETRQIALSVDADRSDVTLALWDSGRPFDVETLLALGKERHTTHADEGGSGIGLMTTFQILQTASASLVIEECDLSHAPYTKCLSVCFDDQAAFRVKTPDPVRAAQLSARPDCIVVE